NRFWDIRQISNDSISTLHSQALRAMGVQRGDRVVAYLPNIPETVIAFQTAPRLADARKAITVAYLPNIPETVIAFLASASLGAVWSSCSPDFGTRSVIDRFQQIEPKVLFAVDGYMYNGKAIDRRATIGELQQSLPTLQKTVLIPYLFPDLSTEAYSDAVLWQ